MATDALELIGYGSQATRGNTTIYGRRTTRYEEAISTPLISSRRTPNFRVHSRFKPRIDFYVGDSGLDV